MELQEREAVEYLNVSCRRRYKSGWNSSLANEATARSSPTGASTSRGLGVGLTWLAVPSSLSFAVGGPSCWRLEPGGEDERNAHSSNFVLAAAPSASPVHCSNDPAHFSGSVFAAENGSSQTVKFKSESEYDSHVI